MVIGFRALLAASAIVPLTLLAGCTQGFSPAVLPGTAAGSAHAEDAGPRGNAIPGSPAPAPISLSETGSTLLYPLFAAWASAYHREFPLVSFTTDATGSGTGIADASRGAADIGASDAFLSSGDLGQHPGMLNIPLAISAQQVNYNLPQLAPGVHVRLTGVVLAQMYLGQIRTWNSPAIAALNAGELLGCELTDRSLRFGLECSFRSQARLTSDRRRQAMLVDLANDVRPSTWS